MINCSDRIVFDSEDVAILGSITPSIRNGKVTAECGLHASLDWPLIFCEQIIEHGKCPEGYRI
jgi:hypothetical protein